MPTYLCNVSEFPDPGAIGLRVPIDSEPTDIVVVRQGGRITAYVNRCPHKGVPLDWLPDQFLDEDKRTLVCATHGARFRPEDGLCIAGPCKGRSLSPIPLTIVDGQIKLATTTP